MSKNERQRVPDPRPLCDSGLYSVRFTREVLDAIPIWLEMGASPAEIAAALNTTYNSLRMKCFSHGISLADRRRSAGSVLRGELNAEQWHAIQHEAAKRGIPVWRLIAQLLTAIIDDKLFNAVLDDKGGP